MSRVIVGSVAAKHWGLTKRISSDLDVWVDNTTLVETGVDSYNRKLDCKVLPKRVFEYLTVEDGFAVPDDLYTIKCSHLGWDNPAWHKHRRDVLEMHHKGCKIKEPLYEVLVEHWKGEFGNREFLCLGKNKQEFFTDNVEYIFDHDELHRTASGDKPPIYTKCLVENEEVLISKSKFEALPFEEQIRMFKEEIHVILFERWIIPHRAKGFSWFQAYPLGTEKDRNNTD